MIRQAAQRATAPACWPAREPACGRHRAAVRLSRSPGAAQRHDRLLRKPRLRFGLQCRPRTIVTRRVSEGAVARLPSRPGTISTVCGAVQRHDRLLRKPRLRFGLQCRPRTIVTRRVSEGAGAPVVIAPRYDFHGLWVRAVNNGSSHLCPRRTGIPAGRRCGPPRRTGIPAGRRC